MSSGDKKLTTENKNLTKEEQDRLNKNLIKKEEKGGESTGALGGISGFIYGKAVEAKDYLTELIVPSLDPSKQTKDVKKEDVKEVKEEGKDINKDVGTRAEEKM